MAEVGEGGCGGPGGVRPPDFGRIEGAAEQWRRAALLLAHPDFQTLRHLCIQAGAMYSGCPGGAIGAPLEYWD